MSTDQDPYAASGETSQGRVFTVTGQDWDSITQSIGESDDEGSWSTWARSTPRPTACSG